MTDDPTDERESMGEVVALCPVCEEPIGPRVTSVVDGYPSYSLRIDCSHCGWPESKDGEREDTDDD